MGRDGAIENVPGESQRCACHDGWPDTDKLLVEQGYLGEVSCHAFDLRIVIDLLENHLKKALDSRMPNNPVKGLQNMPLHLNKHILVVEIAAHRLELADGRNPVLLVPVLGSNEHGCTSNELVVALVHHPAGAVSVEEVDSEVERLGKEGEGGVCLDKEVQEIRTHEPLDFRLDIDAGDVR